jgi:glycosyltransferase involved in cell wall biosynthesis
MRVGIIVFGGNGWLGGRNYLRNLLVALHRQQDLFIEPVLLTGERAEERLADFPPIENVKSDLLDAPRAHQYLRKGVTMMYGRDLHLESLLRRHRIDVLSHSGHLGRRATLPTIGWIADLQCLHLPEFTAPKERRRSDRTHLEYCQFCTKVIVSSECGRADMEHFSPANANKAEILRFVAAPFPRESTSTLAELQIKYGFEENYFLLPNQFWAHKNHRTVITALEILRKRGKRLLVLATGAREDGRKAGHFESLMGYARECGVLDSFRVLGIIPYPDLATLMRSAVALINPSLFEGWSTSVEESKSMGKRIVLSDIPVHREQNPESGIYFSPLNADALADALLQASFEFDLQADLARQEGALANFPARRREFALRYQQIVAAATSQDQRT